MLGDQANISVLNDCARALLPGFTVPDRAAAQGVEGILFINSLAEMVTAPRGEFLVVNCFSLPPELTHARIKVKSWKRHPYLKGLAVHAADIVTLEGPSGQLGMSFHGCAFTDPKRAHDDAQSMYLAIMESAGRINPYFEELYPLLKREHFDVRKYGIYLNEMRNRHHELAHARDYVFSAEFLGRPEQSLNDIEDSLCVYKPNSGLWAQLEAKMPTGNLPTVRANMLLREYSASLGGILSEMRTHLRARQPDLAFMAFLDYMGTFEMMLAVGPQEGRVEPVVAAFHYRRLSSLALHSPHTVLGTVLSGFGKPADNAYGILEQLYDLDLWNDEKRAALLAARKGP